MLEIKRIIYKSPYPYHPHISSSYTKKGNSYTIQLIKLFCDRFLGNTGVSSQNSCLPSAQAGRSQCERNNLLLFWTLTPEF